MCKVLSSPAIALLFTVHFQLYGAGNLSMIAASQDTADLMQEMRQQLAELSELKQAAMYKAYEWQGKVRSGLAEVMRLIDEE